MNFKKVSMVALAGALAVSTVSAFAVSAATTGYSDEGTDYTIVDGATETVEVVEGEETTGSVEVADEDLSLEFTIPADVLEDISEIVFNTDVLDYPTVDEIIADEYTSITDYKVLDLYFTDAESGVVVDMTGANVTITVKDTTFNTVYYFNEDSNVLELVESVFENNTLTFTAPHFSIYVLAEEGSTEESSEDESSDEESTSAASTSEESTASTGTVSTVSTTTSTDTDTTNTGDNAFSTIALFAGVAAVALATSIVAVKTKKASK